LFFKATPNFWAFLPLQADFFSWFTYKLEMKLVLEKLKQNPKDVLTEYFAGVTHVRHSCNTWYTLATGCVWKISREPPVKMFQKITSKYLSQILNQLKTAFVKTKQAELVGYIALVMGLLKSIVDPRSPFVKEIFQYMADLDFLDDGVFWALLDQPNDTIGTKDNAVFKIGQSTGGKFITDPGIAKDLRVSKRSGLHSTNYPTVPWDVPDEFCAALSCALLSGCCPRNSNKERVVLQIAGKHAVPFVEWFMDNILGDYGCRTQSVIQIPRDNTRQSRVIFFELDSLSKHVPILLRQVRKRKVHPLLVFITPDDKTRLPGIHSYWEPLAYKTTTVAPDSGCEGVIATQPTTLSFLLDGYKWYSANGCLLAAQTDNACTNANETSQMSQMTKLLNEFLTERQIEPSHKKTASRMKFAELAEILKNRAIRQGFHLLPVHQKDLVHEIKARNFKIVRPQGTMFFKYTTVDTEMIVDAALAQ
jgi:hypothetical protein